MDDRVTLGSLTRQARISYWFILLTIVIVGWLRLATPLLAVLFSYFVLSKLHFTRNRWVAVWLFVVVLLGIAYGLGSLVNQAIITLPKVATNAIPQVIAWAEEHRIELPFTDYQSLRAVMLDTVKDQMHYLGNAANFAKGATAHFVFLVIGCVAAVSIFLNSQIDLDHARHLVRNNVYSLSAQEISKRFRGFYQSFVTVMGAQILISAINTGLTSVFVLVVQLPHASVVIGLTFLCGLFPVIGNLMSNTIIVGISFTVSPKLALAALIFLVVIHKLEYFLNSKIIGDRIRNPVWLTLLGLILGEKLMGIPGMILAPVILNYLKTEASRIEVPSMTLSSEALAPPMTAPGVNVTPTTTKPAPAAEVKT
jgi:predicted PurR-regulated permease PerM